MSVHVTTWVWESSRAKGTDRLVLLAIADYAADHGGDAWPAVSTLAERTRSHPRSVRAATRSLEKLGELEIRTNAGRNGSNMYRVVMNQPEPATPLARDHPPGERPPPSRDQGPPGERPGPPWRETTRPTQEPPLNHPEELNASAIAAAAPEPIEAPLLELLTPDPPPPKPRAAKRAADVERADVERLCRRLADAIEGNGSKRPVITVKWRAAARLMLDSDGHTETQIGAAIDWCQADEFWRSNILSMPTLRQRYDRLRLEARRPKNPFGRRRADVDEVFEAYETRLKQAQLIR